jgi:hypothetical protein
MGLNNVAPATGWRRRVAAGKVLAGRHPRARRHIPLVLLRSAARLGLGLLINLPLTQQPCVRNSSVPATTIPPFRSAPPPPHKAAHPAADASTRPHQLACSIRNGPIGGTIQIASWPGGRGRLNLLPIDRFGRRYLASAVRAGGHVFVKTRGELALAPICRSDDHQEAPNRHE